jgi:hypothetical protein
MGNVTCLTLLWPAGHTGPAIHKRVKEEDCQPVRSVLLIPTTLVFHRTTFGSDDGIRYNVSIYLCTRYKLY